ncbi:MAG: hypothetical protein KJ067_04260 [Vicinamibacteria bacterium]|nr:hypothetical protein [Vicinamibacteria bacterium]
MGSERPVVLLGVHHGFSVRFLLQTDILRRLRERARVVIVAAEEGSYLDAWRGLEGVSVEVVPRAACAAYFAASRLQGVLRQVRAQLYGGPNVTGDILAAISAQEALAERRGLRRLALRARLAAYGLARLALGRSATLRRALLRFESRRFVPPLYDAILDRHAPDLVVTSSLGTFDWDQYLMRAAARRGIRVATVVLSWDNTTTRGYPGAPVDHVVAWTETMRRELAALHDVDPARVSVAGSPQFDADFRPDPGFERDAFLRSVGADPARRVVFFAARSPNSYPWNPNIVKILAEAAGAGRLHGAQVVARIHPLYYKRRDDGSFVYQDVLDAFHRVAAEHPGDLVLNVPRFSSEELDFAMPEDEIVLLTRLMRACDAIVTVFSTINIEGSILDKPLVNVCFENLPLLYAAKMRARFDIVADSRTVHNARVVATGGVRLARTPDELVAAVARALADPADGAEGRRRIVADEAGPNPGRAGEAVADALLRFAGARP